MNRHDKEILRSLAGKQACYAAGDENQSKIKRWYRHNAMKNQPMVLAELFGIYDEIGFEKELLCIDIKARDIELILRQNLYLHEFIKDDSVIDPYYKIRWDINDSGCGVSLGVKRADDTDGKEWGMEIKPPLKNLAEDLSKLKQRKYWVDREATLRQTEEIDSIFGDILPVKINGDYWWSMGIAHNAIYFTGHQEFMMFMYDQPEELHQLMQFTYDDRLGLAKWMESEGLLNMNNANNYIGSGSRGFTEELEQTGAVVQTTDLWGLLESQPTGYVSPGMFREFVFDYQLRMAENFGLIYYGCCEPLHDRMHLIKNIPNLKSVSVSPFSNEEIMADQIADNYIYSRKPDPVILSTDWYSEQVIIDNTTDTLRKAADCEIEFVMKDLHTVRYQPKRLKRWVEVTRQTIDSF